MLVGCQWTEELEGCAPADLGCGLSERYRDKNILNQTAKVKSKTEIRNCVCICFRQSYLLEHGEVSFIAKKSLVELTFLNCACSQG